MKNRPEENHTVSPPTGFHFQEESIMKFILLTTLLLSFAHAAVSPPTPAPAQGVQGVGPEPRSLAESPLAAVSLADWVQRKHAASVNIDSLGSSMTVLAYKLVQFFDSHKAAVEGLEKLIALKSIQSDHKIMELLRQPIMKEKPYGTLMNLVITSLKRAISQNFDKTGHASRRFMRRISNRFDGYFNGYTGVVPMEMQAFSGVIMLISFPCTESTRKRRMSDLLPVLLIKDVPDTLDRLGLWSRITSCISEAIIGRHSPPALSETMAIMHGMDSKQKDLLKILKDSIEGLMKNGYSDDVCYHSMLSRIVEPAGTFWSLRSALRTELVKMCPVDCKSPDVGEFYKAVFSKDVNWEENVYRSKVGKAAIKCILQSPKYESLDVPNFTAKGILMTPSKTDNVFYVFTSKKVHKSTAEDEFFDIHVGDTFGFCSASPFVDYLDQQLQRGINRAHPYIFGDLKSSGLDLFAAYINGISVYRVVNRAAFRQRIKKSFSGAVSPKDKS
jgi:hypothetical protein